ncbi:hypothetical protein FUAX_05000 [Fulvitalea axinellae]|uniref:Uncharacterized protein n=1 Tax=Fulvitalea axinellae TaxID=1182444 RepID=A0AAU9CE37_9BACT|nr:hypothetical protein FUAX_05000 [Fulvitalea axinellae]
MTKKLLLYTLLYIGASIILTILIFNHLKVYFHAFSFGLLKNISVTEYPCFGGFPGKDVFIKDMTFTASIVIIPLLYPPCNKIAKFRGLQKVYSLGIILLSGFLFLIAKLYTLNGKIPSLIGYKPRTEIPYSELTHASYLFAGVITGAVLATVFFTYRNRSGKGDVNP